MKIAIFGSGYVGLVQAAVFADVGHKVTCVDIDASRVKSLKELEIPFYEPGLEALVSQALTQELLSFTTEFDRAVRENDFLFICVGTPSNPDGSANLDAVLAVADSIAAHINDYKVIVVKSTVPVGTADLVSDRVSGKLNARHSTFAFDVCSNPEFLKEGSAVADAKSPDRIILGCRSDEPIEALRELYQAFNRNRERIFTMDPRSAELTKYAANAMLATKISFINEIANVAERVGADIELVRKGIGADPRIGYQFIYAGAGYGGSCFPKDVKALSTLAQQHDYFPELLDAVHHVNERQKQKLGHHVVESLGDCLDGITVAVWGLSFKPNTDDLREAPSLSLIDLLWSRGAKVRVFDPYAIPAFKTLYGERPDTYLSASKEDAVIGADCLVICTEWKAFWSPDFEELMARMSRPLIIDGRNLYNPAQMEQLGFEYYGIGRGLSIRGA